MIEQISKFVDLLNAAAAGAPQRMRFSMGAIPSVMEFILTGDHLLYNKNIKLFHKILKDLLYGKLELSFSPIPSLPAEPILFFDVHQFVWEAVNRISEEDILSICGTVDSLMVSKTKHPVKDFSLFSRDSIDSIVVFYFQIIPKPAGIFLQDFESTNNVHYFRSLIRMALLDYIKLERHEEKREDAGFGNIPRSPESVPAPERTVQNVIDVVPDKTDVVWFDHVPQVNGPETKEEKIESPAEHVPSMQQVHVHREQEKNVPKRSSNEIKIANLRKILQNIKQL